MNKKVKQCMKSMVSGQKTDIEIAGILGISIIEVDRLFIKYNKIIRKRKNIKRFFIFIIDDMEIIVNGIIKLIRFIFDDR